MGRSSSGTAKRRPTIRDVARRAGVGTGTISRALNAPQTVSPEMLSRVRAAIQELGYQPNETARSLARGRSKMVAVLIPDIANPYFSTLTRGVTDEARASGFNVIIGNTDGRPAEEAQLVSGLSRRPVDGILWVPSSAQPPQRPREVPVVLVDRLWQGVELDRVTADSRGGMFQMVSALARWGHREIYHLGGPVGVDTADDRVAGYLDAMELLGGAAADWISRGRFSIESGYRRTRHWLEAGRRPTAIAAANDLLAMGALRALAEAGIAVPEEVSVTGYDDLPLAALLRPPLTTVQQPGYAMGREAMRLLLRRLAGHAGPPQAVQLASRLSLRQSAGPPPAARWAGAGRPPRPARAGAAG